MTAATVTPADLAPLTAPAPGGSTPARRGRTPAPAAAPSPPPPVPTPVRAHPAARAIRALRSPR
nr:hypothetical protein StreXyl84_36950 [Streptomyces sp. Xyl84]